MVKNSRKLILLLIVLLAVAGSVIHAAGSDDLIKRTILIMPVFNQNKNSETHLADNIRDALRAKLDQKKMFNLIDFSIIDQKIQDFNYTESDLMNEDKCILLAKELQADVALQSEYSVDGEKIFILAQAVDIIAGQPTVSTYITGIVGFEIFTYINNIANDMAVKMAQKFSQIERGMLDQLMREQSVVIEESDDTVIGRLLLQTDKYRKFMVKRAGIERALAVPFGRNVVILISDKYDEYVIRVNEAQYNAQKGLKILVFDNVPGATRTIEVLSNNKVVKVVKYTQHKNYQVDTIRLRFVQ